MPVTNCCTVNVTSSLLWSTIKLDTLQCAEKNKRRGHILPSLLDGFECTLTDKLQERPSDTETRLLMKSICFYALKTEAFVSFNRYTPEYTPSIIRDVIFFLDSSGNLASWMLSQSLLTGLSCPFISWFLFCFLHNVLVLCKRWMFGMVIVSADLLIDRVQTSPSAVAAMLSSSVHGCC